MKSLIALLREVLSDEGTRCCTSTTNDFKTVVRRSEHEGESFLTITLSNFGHEFQKALDQGYVGYDQFSSFSKNGGLPRFLGGFLIQVFDRRGRLLDCPSIDAIRAVRQITLMFAKINKPCSEKRLQAAYDKYIETELEVRHYDQTLSEIPKESHEGESNASTFARIGHLLWRRLFTEVDTRVFNGDVMPKHGSGATADRLSGNGKYNQSVWTERLESVFPYWEHLLPGPSFLPELSGGEDAVTVSSPGTEIPVKVILVPKTLKTPRVIAMEPTCMQYMQQGLLEIITKEIREHDHASNFVCSDSQIPNQVLAKQGSSDGTLATLDLSEASDRVSNQHVLLLLAKHSITRDAVQACRSRKADVQGKTIRLAKFASMGSALCFPFEALVFTTAVFVGIEKQLNRRLTEKDIKSFYGVVRVYGDDIIVPVDYVQSVLQAFETFGFRVNVNKSYWTGKFRESCGKDYYDVHDVSIVRVRRMLPGSRKHVPELVSTVSLRNQLFRAGFVNTVDFLDSRIEKLIPFPTITDDMARKIDTVDLRYPTSVLLGRLSYYPCQVDDWDEDLHYPLVRGVKVVSVSPASKLDGTGALLKWFLKRGVTPFEDKNHLERAGRSKCARIKKHLARPY